MSMIFTLFFSLFFSENFGRKRAIFSFDTMTEEDCIFALFLSSNGFACKFLPLENFGYKFICKPNCVVTLGKTGGKGGFLVKNKGI